MIKLIYCSLISLLFFSCNGDNSMLTEKNNLRLTDTKNTSKTNGKVLIKNIKTHLFSENAKLDTFKLILSGDSLSTSVAVFSIISNNGKLIFSDSFCGSDLSFGHNFENPSLSQIENAIKHKVSIFFNDSFFVNANTEPAVATCGDHGIPDSINWYDIHSNKNVIGFHYFFDGEIDDNYIAWSKKQDKVVFYWYNND